MSPGRLFLRTARLFGLNQMRDVEIYDLSDPQHRRTIRADSGLLELSSNRQDLLLTLFHGSMTELPTEDPTRLRRVFFSTDFVKVRNVGNSLERDSVGGEKSDREMTVCELQRRVVRLARSRDSVYRVIKALDSNVAKTMKTNSVRGGLGALYCHRLVGLKLVRTASAAEPPAVQPQPQGRSPAPFPDEPQPPGQRSVQAEQLKIQLGLAQNTIDGDQVEIEKKFAIAAACVIFVLLGAPVALRFPRGGVGLTIGVSLGVFGLYYVGLIGGETLARSNLVSPFWAMWSTNFMLLAVGLALTSRLGREGTTSRGSETSDLLLRLRERFAVWRGTSR